RRGAARDPVGRRIAGGDHAHARTRPGTCGRLRPDRGGDPLARSDRDPASVPLRSGRASPRGRDRPGAGRGERSGPAPPSPDRPALDDPLLLVSGLTSFEILQTAAVAGIPIVCAISGPTTLAIETARAFNITLVNFLRGHGMNIASCPERIV